MKIKVLIVILITITLFSISACDNSNTDSTTSPTSAPTETPTITPSPLNVSDIQGISFDMDMPSYVGKELTYCTSNINTSIAAGINLLPIDDIHIGVISHGFAMSGPGAKNYYQIDIYNLKTGLLIGTKVFDSSTCYLFIDNSNLLVFDCSTALLYTFYDYSFTNYTTLDLSSHLVSTNGYDGQYYCSNGLAYLNNKIYYTNNNSLFSLNLDSLQKETIITPDTNGANSMSFFTTSPRTNGFCVTFTVYGPITTYYQYHIDQNGSVSELQTYGQSLYFDYDQSVVSYSYKYNTLTKYNGTNTTTIHLNTYELLDCIFDQYMFSILYNYDVENAQSNNTIYVYDLKNGDQILSHTVLSAINSIVLMPENTVAIYVTGDYKVYAIPVSKEMGTENTKNQLYMEQGVLITKESNNLYTKELESKYGITIGIYEDGIRDFTDFVAMENSDHLAIKYALDDLDRTLSKFPEGFVQELTSFGLLTKLHILFTGQMAPTSNTGTSNPVAFAVSDYPNKTKYLIFNINDMAFSRTVAHELMHYIEDQVLYSSANTSKGDSFSRWSQLNPAGFSYNYSYVDKNGNDYSDTTYCYNTSSQDNAYFVDAYSKTFASEDRARIMEYLISEDENSNVYFDCPHIKYKAQYLIDVIKSVFTTWENTEGLDWLNKISN